MNRIPDHVVAAMYAEYEAGASLGNVARKHGRSGKGLGEIFRRRGYNVRHGTNPYAKRNANGSYQRAVPLTEAEIQQLIDRVTKLHVPPELKREWREWPMDRRGDFIARVRRRLKSPKDRPDLPFSPNVIPFDYTTAQAREIADRMNAGCDSRNARIKIDICSQGVIWRDRLWFWSSKVGYQCGPWTAESGRPLLHRAIWEDHHRRPVPPGHVIFFRDGNPNNLMPENLGIRSRNDLARENQAAGLNRRSRELTRILLTRTQRKETRNGVINQLAQAGS